jgi:hypothetical protein
VAVAQMRERWEDIGYVSVTESNCKRCSTLDLPTVSLQVKIPDAPIDRLIDTIANRQLRGEELGL